MMQPKSVMVDCLYCIGKIGIIYGEDWLPLPYKATHAICGKINHVLSSNKIIKDMTTQQRLERARQEIADFYRPYVGKITKRDEFGLLTEFSITDDRCVISENINVALQNEKKRLIMHIHTPTERLRHV